MADTAFGDITYGSTPETNSACLVDQQLTPSRQDAVDRLFELVKTNEWASLSSTLTRESGASSELPLLVCQSHCAYP